MPSLPVDKVSASEMALQRPSGPIKTMRLTFPHLSNRPVDEQPVAVVLDNVFSAEECEAFLRSATESCGDNWKRAEVQFGGNRKEAEVTAIRNSDRIMYDSPDIAAQIWERVEPALDCHIKSIRNKPQITGAMPALQGQIWSAAQLNHRLRFLRYGPGEYFKPHFDGGVNLPGRQKGYFTLHLYLNERTESNELVGGATIMHGPDLDPAHDVYVEAKLGRVLVFQQRNVLHSGQDVSSGIKLTMRTDVMYALAKQTVPVEERMTLAQLRGKC